MSTVPLSEFTLQTIQLLRMTGEELSGKSGAGRKVIMVKRELSVIKLKTPRPQRYVVLPLPCGAVLSAQSHEAFQR